MEVTANPSTSTACLRVSVVNFLPESLAVPDSSDTSADFTPLTAFNTSCTRFWQWPQLIPSIDKTTELNLSNIIIPTPFNQTRMYRANIPTAHNTTHKTATPAHKTGIPRRTIGEVFSFFADNTRLRAKNGTGNNDKNTMFKLTAEIQRLSAISLNPPNDNAENSPLISISSPAISKNNESTLCSECRRVYALHEYAATPVKTTPPANKQVLARK